jgi:hypothetical protein
VSIRRIAALAAALWLAIGCSAAGEEEEEATDQAGATTKSGPAPGTCPNPSPEVITVKAPAPIGLGIHHLGRPVDADFQPIPGEAGKSLFVTDTVRTTTVNSIEHKFTTIETTRGFSANVRAWAFAAGASTRTTNRYASYHAYQIADVREIDDATQMNTAPPGAVYYLWRIHYGHSFEMVVSGEDRSFTTNVRAEFLVAGGGISAFASSHNLAATAIGRGLEPLTGEAIFATSTSQITSSYTSKGEPVPIFAEYRSIPKTCIPPDEQINWRQPGKIRVAFDKVNVYDDGSFGSDEWSLNAKCTVNDKEVPLTNIEVMPKTGVSDNCDDDLKGPKGNSSYCAYDLSWATNLEVLDGDQIRCGVDGTAWDGPKNIPFSQFTYTMKAENAPVRDKFGTGANGTEYWLFYSLTFPK